MQILFSVPFTNWYIELIRLLLFSGEKPTLLEPSLRSIVTNVEKTVRMKCDFYSWEKEWKMVWYYNDKVIQIRGNKRIRQRNGRSSFLRIKDVRKTDSGIYKCVASNKYGSVSKQLNLNVKGKLIV